MPEVVRMAFTGQAGGENSRDLPFDLDPRSNQVAKLTNLLPGSTSTPRYGNPLVATTNEATEIDWVYAFRDPDRPALFVAKSGLDLIQIDTTGAASMVKADAFPTTDSTPCAERVGESVIIGCDYPGESKSWVVTRDGGSLVARPANILRPDTMAWGVTNVESTAAWASPGRTVRSFAATWVNRKDEPSLSPGGLPMTTETWGNPIAESYENIEERLIFEGTDSPLTYETQVTVTVNAIPEGATHLRLWVSLGYDWQSTIPGDAVVEAQGGNKRFWVDISIYDAVATGAGPQFSRALQLTDAQLSGQTYIVDTTGLNEIPPTGFLRFHNGLMWAGGANFGNNPGRCYYSMDISAEPVRSLTLFSLSDRAVDTSADGTERTMGCAVSHGHLYFINERDVHQLLNGDPDKYYPTCIAKGMGTTFPGTIVEHNQQIWYLSSHGPATIADGVVELVNDFAVDKVWPNPAGGTSYFHQLTHAERRKVKSWWSRGIWYISDGKVTVAYMVDSGKPRGGFEVAIPDAAGITPKLPAPIDEDSCYIFGNKKMARWGVPGVYYDGDGALFTATVTYRRGRIDGRRKEKVAEAYDILAHVYWKDEGQLMTMIESQGGRGYSLYAYEQRPITDPLQNTDIADAYRGVIQQGVAEADNIVGTWFQVTVTKVIRGVFQINGMDVGVLMRPGHEFEYVSVSTRQDPPTIDAGLAIFDQEMNRGYNG